VLVRLEEQVLRVDGHREDEAAVEAADVDVLLVVVGGVDVRPADRGAEDVAADARVLVAAGVVGVGRGALAGAGAGEVAEAVVQLRARPQDRAEGAVGANLAQLEAGQLVDLPVGAAEVLADVGEVEAGVGAQGDVAAAGLVDPLRHPHALRPVAVAADLDRPAPAALDVGGRVQERLALVGRDVHFARRPDPQVGAEEVPGTRPDAGVLRRRRSEARRRARDRDGEDERDGEERARRLHPREPIPAVPVSGPIAMVGTSDGRSA
jgi:hypothetical protein